MAQFTAGVEKIALGVKGKMNISGLDVLPAGAQPTPFNESACAEILRNSLSFMCFSLGLQITGAHAIPHTSHSG
jgi:hypothetical protein